MWRPEVMVFVWLSVGSVAMFSFLAVASWTGTRARERESYYKNDMLKKLAEAPAGGAEAALQLLREQSQLAQVKRRQGLRIGGLITAATGLGLMIFLKGMVHNQPVFLSGLVVLLIGIAQYAGSYLVGPAKESNDQAQSSGTRLL